MAIIGVPDGMPELSEAIKRNGFQVARLPRPPWKTAPPVDLIILKEPGLKRMRRLRSFITVPILAITSEGAGKRIRLVIEGANRCLASSESPRVVAHANALLRMASRQA